MNNSVTEMRSDFISQIKEIIVQAQSNVVRAVDYQRVLMYWNIIFPIVNALRSQLNWTQYRLLMYVNYYDSTQKLPEDNKTIPSSQYRLYLP